MNTYDYTYRGLIIQNNDPANTGRVKVFVPGINLTQTKNWNQKKEEDKYFKYLGSNTQSAITTDILQTQKEKLFWAEVMLPINGMCSPGVYDASSDIFYIGNDSDYIFQNSNKSSEFFKRDREETERRKSNTSYNPNYGSEPRISISLNFPQSNYKYCINYKCDNSQNSNNYPSIWKNKNGIIDDVVKKLPVSYNSECLKLDDDSYKNKNTSVISVEIDVSNPTVYVNDVVVPKDSLIYNTHCFTVVDVTNKTTFNPTLIFEDSDEEATANYDQLPVTININGKSSFDKPFDLLTYDKDKVIFSKDQFKISIPRTNINFVKIKHNKNKFDINKILSLLPILFNALSDIIMPRAPITNGETMYSRGGGGGEIFNNISSSLLPTNMRLNSHIGGANNECRYTINNSRLPLYDPNNTKGCNLIGNVSQAHRGPMRSPDYNNDWKGTMSIPSVGAHVWVRFENGDCNYPIIIGTYTNQSGYKGIFEKSM